MSKPFIFRPSSDGSPQHSPFLPPSPFLPHGTPSPMSNNVQLPHGSPNLLPIQFPPGSPAGLEFDPAVGWRKHGRAPSWSGQAPPGDFLHPHFAPQGRPRTQSFGGIGGQHSLAPGGRQPVELKYHPWLDGRAPRDDLWFDLSMGIYSPRRMTRVDQMGMPGMAQIPITADELAAAATYPSVAGMRIVFDALPQFPIDVTLRQPGPGLTVGDVLQTIYAQMQHPIEQHDFDELSEEMKRRVSKAYSQRCHALGASAQEERGKGVKRVDLLVGKVVFRGLLPDGDRLRVIVQ